MCTNPSHILSVRHFSDAQFCLTDDAWGFEPPRRECSLKESGLASRPDFMDVVALHTVRIYYSGWPVDINAASAMHYRMSVVLIKLRAQTKHFVNVLTLSSAIILALVGCKRPQPVIAVIPRTCGTALWEPEHVGAAAAARSNGLDIYWNAPMQDDDIQTQISLVEKAQARGYAGIIISPIETLPLRTPIRRVLADRIPVVVIGTDLGIPAGGKLAYVLNDEQAGGQMAARRIGSILHGNGTIAILGINPQLMSIITRERSFETTLAREFPHIKVVVRRFGFSSVPREQQAAEELLNNGEHLDAIVALSLSSTRGAYYALVEFGEENAIKLVGFDQDLLPPIRTGGIDSIVAQNTYEMGRLAMGIMERELHGSAIAPELTVPPVLMTRENMDSPEIRQILNLKWWAQ
jgi:ribose transport system substrate-binding protein